MRYGLILALFVAVPCWSQTTTTGKAATEGPCSPAVTGSNNTFTINCGIDKKQGQKMLDILNKILANQLDPDAVMSKLDEILNAVNPNTPVKAYFCNGEWRSVGPGGSNGGVIGMQMLLGGDDSAFEKMRGLYNSKQYADLLKECRGQISAKPGWLTPHLFCGLAYLATGDKAKAREMLAYFDSKTGPYYTAEPCKQMSDILHRALQPLISK